MAQIANATISTRSCNLLRLIRGSGRDAKWSSNFAKRVCAMAASVQIEKTRRHVRLCNGSRQAKLLTLPNVTGFDAIALGCDGTSAVGKSWRILGFVEVC